MGKKKELEIELKKENNKRKNSNKIGASFEERIKKVLDELRKEKICIINKVPTEIRMVRGAKGRIVSAFPVKESAWLDFHGYAKGMGIFFEAKTHQGRTSFPISNFSDYQIPLMEEYISYGCKGFVIIEFRALDRIFILEVSVLKDILEHLDRKSIPLATFENKGTELNNLNELKDFIKSLTNIYK